MVGHYGPFAAAADNSVESLSALATLLPEGETLWLVEPDEVNLPPGTVVVRQALCVQMVASAITPAPLSFDIVPLNEDDAPEMRTLATLTEPGPFHARTHQLGRFVGTKVGGRLVAMAGERMRPLGYVEVSGVCTHPDFRGRGYAAGLMRQVATRILAEGDAPFLHAYASNTGAIGLYESLGFRVRRTVAATIVGRG